MFLKWLLQLLLKSMKLSADFNTMGSPLCSVSKAYETASLNKHIYSSSHHGSSLEPAQSIGQLL